MIKMAKKRLNSFYNINKADSVGNLFLEWTKLDLEVYHIMSFLIKLTSSSVN